MLEVALLGTGGMMPLPNRFLTSMLCRYKGKLLLVDCGEGTQVTNKMLGWGFKNIDTICITHIHGDHITGLTGMLFTMANSHREEAVNIVGPQGVKEVVEALLIIAKDLAFQLNYYELTEDTEKITLGDFNISALKVDHRILCYSYKIEIKRVGKFSTEKAIENHIPREIWSNLQRKEVVEHQNNIYLPEMVLGEDRKSIVLSYMTDTRPIDAAYEFVKGSDLFICEGLYGDNEKLDKAIEHKHMTFIEAAEIAKKADVKELWLTHYSPALTVPEDYIQNARDVFKNTFLGEDRKTTTIFFE
ncbi:MAG: ribonuclease Z [Lachnospirales bacterium]